MFMRKKIAMVLFVAAVALIGVFAFRAFRQNIPDQSPDNSGEVIEQTEEGSSAGVDLSIQEAVEASNVVGDLSIPEPDTESEAISNQEDAEPEDVSEENPKENSGENPEVNPETEPNVVTAQPVSQDIYHQSTDALIATRQETDLHVIPDRFNCGAWGNFTKVLAGDTVNGIVLQESEGINSFDFFNRNTDISGEIYFSGYDFSDYIVEIYNSDLIDRDITLVFENCNFFIFRSLSAYPKVNLVFKNCTFNSFYGSCAEFTYCKFGGYYRDGLVPYHDVTVRNCYFSNFTSQDPAGSGYHSDGTQIYGKEGINAENIRYEFCRFEVPCIPGPNAVNACIMLQLEYSSGINILFDKCYVNGGGYSIYATSKDKGFQFYRNVVISNILVGQSRKYGSVCPTVAEGVSVSNIFDIDSLYVASVWKANGKTHLSVTNDTLQDRLLVVYADGVRSEYPIPASRGGKDSYFDCFGDYPIDIDIWIDADCQNIVCFDCTGGLYKQIRFVTWDGSDSVSIPL